MALSPLVSKRFNTAARAAATPLSEATGLLAWGGLLLLLPCLLCCKGQEVQAALQLSGKPPCWRWQLVAPALSSNPLIYLKDQLSGRCFLVDTGAAQSLILHWSAQPPSGPALEGAGSKPIASWGSQQLTVKFGGQKFSTCSCY